MRSRDRIIKVLNYEIPDRVPFDGMLPTKSDFLYMFLVPPKLWQPTDQWGVYPNVYSLIMRAKLWKWKPTTWIPPKKWRHISRKAEDPFGCVWEYADNDVTKGHPGTTQPMKSYSELDGWKFPNPYDKSQYKFSGRIAKFFPHKYKIGLLDSLLFARVQYLRGFNQSLIDLSRNKDDMIRLIDKLTTYYLGAIEMWAKYGADAVMGMDDMGAQDELFMSPRMYKQFFAPAYKKLCDRAHELGLKFFLHSCGHVNKLIPIWIECGIDLLQFDSPHMTGLEYNSQFVGKIAFMLTPDIQKVYPFASLDEFEDEIKIMIKMFGQNGGLILKDYDAPKALNIPTENTKNFPKIVKKWGKYPFFVKK